MMDHQLEAMSRNFALLSFHRENGSFQRNIAKQKSTFNFLREQDLTFNFHQQNMKKICCLNSMKCHIPGRLELEVPPYATEFCTVRGCEYIFSVADEDGNVSLFSSLYSPSESKPFSSLHKFHAHDNAIFDIAWVPKEHILITASGDKTASVWDMVEGTVTEKLTGHSCSLRSVNVSKHNTNLLVTGSRDGNALVWDRRSAQSIVRIQDAHVVTDSATPKRRRRTAMSEQTQLVNDSQQTVSCALFQDAQTVVTAGTRDGTLKIWDLRKLKQIKKVTAKNKVQPIETLPYPGSSLRRRGYTCLTFDSSNSHLYASCTDDSVYHYNLATACSDGKRMPICRYSGHINSSFYVRTTLSYDDQFLFGGSCDSKAYIWKADGKCGEPMVRLTSDGMSEVTAVAWCPSDINHLVTCSDDCVVRLWKISDEKQENKSKIDGTAETVTKNSLGCKCGCNYSPISAVSRPPAPKSSTAVTPVTGMIRATPEKYLKDTNSILTTPKRKLVQTSVTSLFTPPRAAKTPSSTKTITPSRDTSNDENASTSSEKCHTGRTSADNKVTPGKRRAFKSLDSEMNSCEVNAKENVPSDSPDNSFTTPKKNWLLELIGKRKSEGGKSASKRQRRASSSPASASNSGENSRRQGKAISSYFKNGSLF